MSKLQDAKDAFYEYADYEEVGSTERANKFITAGRRLLLLMPSEWRAGSVSHRHEKDAIEKAIEKAQVYVTSQTSTGRITHLDPTQARLDRV